RGAEVTSLHSRGTTMKRILLAGLVLFAGAAVARAEDKKPDLPVTATLTAKTTSYKLDLGGKSADEFKQMLKDAEKSGTVPEPPKVELTLELKNNTDKDVQVWVGGD